MKYCSWPDPPHQSYLTHLKDLCLEALGDWPFMFSTQPLHHLTLLLPLPHHISIPVYMWMKPHSQRPLGTLSLSNKARPGDWPQRGRVCSAGDRAGDRAEAGRGAGVGLHPGSGSLCSGWVRAREARVALVRRCWISEIFAG